MPLSMSRKRPATLRVRSSFKKFEMPVNVPFEKGEKFFLSD